jgi:hypothetical protein
MVDLYPVGSLSTDCRDGTFSATTNYGRTVNEKATNNPFVYIGVFSSSDATNDPSTNPEPKYGY